MQLLDRLRRRIRWYVVIEGCAMLIVWLVGAFWIGLALDYLPVLVGANEMPRTARMVALAIAGIGAMFVLYYFILRRVFRRLRDASLALLIERQFPVFCDSLVTTVEINDRRDLALDQTDLEAIRSAQSSFAADGVLESEMLARTVERAESAAAVVQLGKVFRYAPMASKLAAAIVALITLAVLGLYSDGALGVGVSRLVFLSDDPWPRRARIELLDFDDAGQKKIAKGADLVLRVRADAQRGYPTPELCSILYETSDGDRGRVNMSRDGEERDGFQYYVFSGKPFKAILNDIRFDVIGSDHRLRDQSVKVVLSPVVSSVQVRSELPAYTGLLPRDETYVSGMQLPIGSKVTARIQTSKDLVSATIRDIDTGDEEVLEFRPEQQRREIVYQMDELTGRMGLSVSLLDTDGIGSQEPFLLTIGAVEDQIPKVELSLRGIGNAITSVARLPVEGSITDDYLVDRTWFQIKIGEEIREFEFPVIDGDVEDLVLDLREEASANKAKPLRLEPQDRLVFAVKASDRFDLNETQHIGSSEPTTLTVVRPDELLGILDGRELGLRRRFEQIRTEMMQSRDSLARLRSSFKEEPSSVEQTESEPAESANGEAVDPDVAARNQAALRDRWASWAAQKSEQTVLEIEGIALAFEDIREELTNNRIDTPERKSRMEEQIIAPLHAIASERFPELTRSLSTLRGFLSTSDPAAENQSVLVVENADNIIVAMDEVLDKMLELEDYAEIVNVVRQIIEQQEDLQRRTQEEQKSRVLDLLK